MFASLNNTTMTTTNNNNAQQVTKMLMIKGTYFAMDLIEKKETEKAFLFNVLNTISGCNTDFWMPKSLVKKEGEEWVLPSWFVQKQFASIA